MMSNVKFTLVNMGTLSMNKFWGEVDRKRAPSATCTVLDLDGTRLLVDPSPYPEQLEQRLFAATGLRTGDVDMVFVTHHHADHRFGLELFTGKPWLMAADVLDEWRAASPQDESLINTFALAEHHLPGGVTLLPTPGHTRSHHSLAVNTAWGRLVVAGDAVMTLDFWEAGEVFNNSANVVQTRETIRQLKQIADLVIPGHGNYFLNPTHAAGQHDS
jgi:glyoxylase-like metal-dependent hydrolase (beta-lactamase superfamily II)